VIKKPVPDYVFIFVFKHFIYIKNSYEINLNLFLHHPFSFELKIPVIFD
jgi:hypothetical protein